MGLPVLAPLLRPWGEGSFISLMIVTALVPAALHVVLALFAVLMHFLRGAKLVDELEQVGDNNLRAFKASLKLARYGLVSVAAVVLFGLGFAALYHLIWHASINEYLYWLTAQVFDLPV